MFSSRSFRFFIVLSIFLCLGVAFSVHADTTDPCDTSIAGQTNAQLQAALNACNADIAKWTTILNNTKQDSASYARDVAALTAKINVAQANIKAKNIAIANLTKDISNKQSTINSLEDQITQGKATLAEILRKTSQIDSYSLPEAILSDKGLSDFFVDVNAYSATDKALENVFAELQNNMTQTQAEKNALKKQQDAETNARAAIEVAKQQVEISQAQKQALLTDSKNKEMAYSQVLADRQAKAAQIRAALFPLRDAGPIPFGTALQYANDASAKTGVRPALILGILQQESNLGQNVGTCVIVDLTSGETKSINTGKIFPNGISPNRDLPVLQSLLATLGRDPFSTKVSCPLSYGYGGAMGPAQFLPSTWKIMSGRLSSVLGKPTPDPWNAQDAIMAMALFLKDLGASTGTYVNERTAACKYYSGMNCYSSSGRPNVGLSYGLSVMAKAQNIQLTMIDPLQGI